MKRLLITLSTILLVMGLAGATCSRQDVGMTAGGIIGGVAGSELTGGSGVGTVAGAVGGAYLGRELSK
ncbi:MAG: hypothetical protein A3F14_03035 [Gammaproteobacteria bacterium RIFCSPHIGHO2_12_FULL_43_28]|nr:MAG: hypothetical protein A3F14_03035 [Gammaproteobacteria bacterium RIFCSPHIGHO2_12_FULL_43_28]